MAKTQARLILKTKGLQQEFAIQREATIGSDHACDVVIDSDRVAAREARIVFDDDRGGFYAESLGAEGTLVDGAPLRARQRLGRVSVITLGGTLDLVFQIVDRPLQDDGTLRTEPEQFEPISPGFEHDEERTAPRPPEVDETEPHGFEPSFPISQQDTKDLLSTDGTTAEQPLRTLTTLQLEIVSPKDLAAIHLLREGDTLVGRKPACGVRIVHWSVSREHAVIAVRDGLTRVKDLGTTNGTFVNDDSIDTEVLLTDGATVTFGHVVARISTRSG
jgi:pSer/pThr/pTyr-binding forkhead associated (FHA) protein